MYLISCDNCGVVLDALKLNFPKENEIFAIDGSIKADVAAWDGSDYVPCTTCPVCDNKILKKY